MKLGVEPTPDLQEIEKNLDVVYQKGFEDGKDTSWEKIEGLKAKIEGLQGDTYLILRAAGDYKKECDQLKRALELACLWSGQHGCPYFENDDPTLPEDIDCKNRSKACEEGKNMYECWIDYCLDKAQSEIEEE